MEITEPRRDSSGRVPVMARRRPYDELRKNLNGQLIEYPGYPIKDSVESHNNVAAEVPSTNLGIVRRALSAVRGYFTKLADAPTPKGKAW